MTRRLRVAGRWLFGDRYGLALWLGLVLWLGLTWRVGILVQDTYATANTLVALADGQLHVTEFPYSLTLGSQPGLHEVDGRFYGRNYGQLALAVPLVWLLDAAATVVDPGLLLSGLWLLCALGFVTTLAGLPEFDRRRTAVVGTAVVGVAFVWTLRVGTDLDPDRLPLAALQLSTLLAAGTVALGLYRLVGLVHGRRAGLAAGLVAGLATPVGFWATIPKRHVLVAAMTVGVVYAFAVSRRREGPAALRARAGAYALAGLVTWTHAFEGFFLVAVLGAIDLVTAPSRRPRELAVVGLVLLLALTPMLATNAAISGNPAQPPRVLPDADGERVPETGSEGSQTTVEGGGETPVRDGPTPTPAPGGRDGSPFGAVVALVATAAGFVFEFAGRALVEGVGVLGQPGRLMHIFVRSGHVPGIRYDINGYEVIELALLEAMPVVGGLGAVPVLVVRAVRTRLQAGDGLPVPWQLSPTRQTDLLVCGLAGVLTLVYLPRLPLFSQLTVRYLLPVVPLCLYGIVRLPAVRAGLAVDWRLLAGLTAGWFGVATAVVGGAIVGLGLALGEAVQLHALVALCVAIPWGVAVLSRSVAPEWIGQRALATAGTASVGVGVSYLVLAATVYFRYGRYAIDVIRAVTAGLPAL